MSGHTPWSEIKHKRDKHQDMILVRYKRSWQFRLAMLLPDFIAHRMPYRIRLAIYNWGIKHI